MEEERIVKLLEAHGMSFDREFHVAFNRLADREQAFAKIDFVVHWNGVDYLAEVDESQHSERRLVCEVTRMVDVMKALSPAKPFTWIRYNPNCFRVNKVVQKVSRAVREAHLIDVIKTHKYTGPKIQYLYYDKDMCDEPASITKNEEFDQLRYMLG